MTTAGFVGYDPERLHVLRRQAGSVVDHLSSVRSLDPAALGAVAAAARVTSSIHIRWLPAIERAGADVSMSGAGDDRRIDLLVGSALGGMYFGVIETAGTGVYLLTDGTASDEDIARAAADPARVRDLVGQWAHAHGIHLGAASVEFLTGEIVHTAQAMQRVPGEPWNESPPGSRTTSREATAMLAASLPIPVALDVLEIAGDPVVTAGWWSQLASPERATLLASDPIAVGNTNGIPATFRDAANRQQLAADLAAADGATHRNARAIAAYLDDAAQHIDPVTGRPVTVQLYAYLPGAFGASGRAAVATGSLDDADHVAVAVPGFDSDVAGMDPAETQRIYHEARVASGETVAVLDWVGYDAPSFDLSFGGVLDAASVASLAPAASGAARLAADVAGLRAMRAGPDPHVTVIGHSYGSTTTAVAGADHDLAADDIVLTGSPGAGTAGSAHDLPTGPDHTWVASPSTDAITMIGHSDGGLRLLGVLGNDPAMDDFGATRITAERDGRGSLVNPLDLPREHQSQFQPGSESLYNVAAIVAGRYGSVRVARPRHQEPLVEWGFPVEIHLFPTDPEADREPSTPTHSAGGEYPACVMVE